MPSPLLDIAGLHLTLEGATILRGLDLAIEAGEAVSIVGPNGAGKSTFLKCLAGIHRHWAGDIRLTGRPLLGIPPRKLARTVSYVPQAQWADMPFTVHEFVLMGRYPHLSPFSTYGTEDREAVEQALTETGTRGLRNRLVHTLSGGERQNVYIAAALAQEADVLLLDEPTAFLDYRHQIDILATIARINREASKTVITVNHDVNAAVRNSDRILALKDGETAFLGTSDDFLRREVLESVFDTPFRFVDDPQSDTPLALPATA